VTIRGPLRRADLPGLYTRVCRTLETCAGHPVVCDVTSVASDAIAVEALCRLQLGARRHGCALRLRGASDELLELVAYLGLADVLRPELAVELER
jgi:ABC-type transporter Mla MlaB component